MPLVLWKWIQITLPCMKLLMLHPTYLMAKENCITFMWANRNGSLCIFRVFFYSHKLFNMYLFWQKLSFIYQFPCWLQLILIVSQMLFRLEPHETNIWTFSICLCLVWQIMFTVNQYFLVWELWQFPDRSGVYRQCSCSVGCTHTAGTLPLVGSVCAVYKMLP